ncbi:hypothetical protein GC175_17055 [bacterium]|nr:hypothetical protein [bacterium]
MTLEAIIADVLATVGALDGIERVYGDPPESLNEFPCVYCYVGDGEMELISEGYQRGIHTLVLIIMQSRTQLPQAADAIKQWPQKVFDALAADVTLGGTVASIVWPLRYRVGMIGYGPANAYLGVRFELKVKVH